MNSTEDEMGRDKDTENPEPEIVVKIQGDYDATRVAYLTQRAIERKERWEKLSHKSQQS